MSLVLSPRPGPPNEQLSSRTLHPIYQALDTHNYTKALKLTSSSEWDIVRALRVHALERSGKKREALVLLWEILVSNVVFVDTGGNNDKEKDPKEVWVELYERIESLSDATDIINDASSSRNNGLDIQLLNAVQRLDVRAYTPIAMPKGGTTSTVIAAASSSASNKSSGKNSKNQKGGKNKSSKKSSANAAAPVLLPPVTDETVLQTLCVTLRIEGLYDTMSEIYFQAMETLSSNKQASDTENYRGVLEEGVSVHFKAVCDCSAVGLEGGVDGSVAGAKNNGDGGNIMTSPQSIVQAQLPKLRTLLNLTKYYERMQTSSLQLAKISAQSLHFQRTAIASLWYKESLQQLVTVLEKIQTLLNDGGSSESGQDDAMSHLQKIALKMLGGLSEVGDIASYCQKIKQKMMLLPRLAESLSSRMVLQAGSDGNGQQHVVSENDWDVYLETLLVQGKKEKALEVLKEIQCTPMVSGANGSDGGDNNVLPQIDDEDTIENHLGSMLPYTQRKKLERLAQLSQELGMHDQAEGYYRELLHVFPDQWTYWVGLVDSCVNMKSPLSSGDSSEDGLMNEDGWERCQSFAKEVISKVESSQKHPLRGPYLLLLELYSIKVRGAIDSEGKEGLVTSLRNEICTYGNKFGPLASCCFADIRSYLGFLVQASSPGVGAGVSDIPNDVLHVLTWAKELWTATTQSNGAECGSKGEISTDEFRERRKKIRMYIFAVQFIYKVAAELEGLTLQLLQTYAPSVSQMVTEWRTSLSVLPGVAPKDGGQKEVLPGDEIALMISQYLQFQATVQSSPNSSTTPSLLQAAGLLEEAIDHSPYNPHLKIATIEIYSQLNAAYRALKIYEDLGVKQIQLDSCSYLILPTLLQGGLYTSAIKLSSSVLRLHGSTSKDVKAFASKSLQNGLFFKAKEMATFQREKMRPSLQLLYSKSLVVDIAALMIPSDLGNGIGDGLKQKAKSPPVSLAEEKGFCGNEEDLARAEQIAIHAEMHFNAPSVIHDAARSTSVDDFVSSDNRDLTVNHFEILHHNSYMTQKEMVADSLHKGYMHSLLTRAVMAVGAANAPKKGKIPKSTDESTYLCQSLSHTLSKTKGFVQQLLMDDVDKPIWDACCGLCEAIVVVISGSDNADSTTGTLAEREKAATSFVESSLQLVQSAKKAFASRCSTVGKSNAHSSLGAMVCQLLPGRVIPFYVLLKTTAMLFSLFGWGKRKRTTKAASGALANLAASFGDLISDMLQVMSQFRSFGGNNGDMTMKSLVEDASSLDFGTDLIQRVIKEIVSSRGMTKNRVDPFLVEMKESLDTFNEEQ